MSKYPANYYLRMSSSFPTRQWVGEGSAIGGESGPQGMSLTETWEVGGTGALGAPTLDPTNATTPIGGATTCWQAFCQVAAYALGVPSSAGKGGGINRLGPGDGNPCARHPDITSLYATRISNVQGIGSNGKTTTNVASWKLIRFDVTFEVPPYAVLSDADTRAYGADDAQVNGGNNPSGNPGEQYRYLIPDFDPSVELLQFPGQFQFPVNQAMLGQASGSVIRHSKGSAIRLLKRRYSMVWVAVPDKGLFSGGGFYAGGQATNVEAALGTVNADWFLGFPPGTMLFEAWEPSPYAYGYFNADISETRIWDCKLHFVYFNPPVSPTDPRRGRWNGGGAQGTVQNLSDGNSYDVGNQGHNCVPAGDGYWYRAYLTGTADIGGNWRYNYTPFYKIFTMCQ